jgi:DNA repair protein RecO (recombination protein O)
MPIYEDEAVVLRHYPLGDSDRIIVWFGPRLGKVRTAAHGVKRPKSRMSGSLEPLNHVQISFYAREGHELGRIQHAELIHSYSGKSSSLNHLFSCTYFVELIHIVAQESQPNPVLFRLLLASLKAAEKKVPIPPLLRYFETWILKISGLYPNYDYCSDCGKYVNDLGFFARMQDGLARCSTCAGRNDIFVGPEASRTLQAIWTHSPEDFSNLPAGAETFEQIEKLTQGLLGMQIDVPLKSYRILKQALKEP